MYRSEYKGKGGIYAKSVADSEYAGKRITTLELNYPRFIHAEFMTHRMFSRNASSSRAIPVERALEAIATYPAMPIHWGKNQPGMQADEEWDSPIVFYDQLTGEKGAICGKEEAWSLEASRTSHVARMYAKAGYHKQIVNRITEPYQFIRVVVTATEWDNFFKLRLHEAAQPEIYELARCMFEVMDKSIPKDLDEDEWHTPYVDDGFSRNGDAMLLSAAKCARVSYKSHDNTDTTKEEDLALAKRLWDMEHMSPFEHQALPMAIEPVSMVEGGLVFEDGITHFDRRGRAWSGNFCGWVQYRKLVEQSIERALDV